MFADVAALLYSVLCILAIVVFVQGLKRTPPDSLFSTKTTALLFGNSHEVAISLSVFASLFQTKTVSLGYGTIP